LEPQEIRIPVRLLKDRDVPALAKLIYGVLDTFVYSGRDASPSLIEIAERSGIVVPNIPRTLRSLQTSGYIAINRDRKRNRYTFLK
jgi:DNA-binding MarR family transcriptional regulator